MVELVRHICSRGYADRLFAFTSHSELIIGLYPELERGIETLHVSYDSCKRVYHMKYFGKPVHQPKFDRRYLKNVGLEKFDDLLSDLKW